MTAHTNCSQRHLISLEAQDLEWLTREMAHQLSREELRLTLSSSKAQEREIASDIDRESRILAALKAFKSG